MLCKLGNLEVSEWYFAITDPNCKRKISNLRYYKDVGWKTDQFLIELHL